MPPAVPPPAPKHILVIDDDPGVRFVLEAMLRRLGFTPLLAASGQEGLALLRDHAASVDCTLVDDTMSEWNGAETRARIRAEFPRAAVLLMSGHYEEAPEGGSEQFLHKPFTMLELESALARKIAARSTAEE